MLVHRGLYILFDPGVAVMHPSYPAPASVKKELWSRGYERIREYLSRTDIVVITHYHYDHYLHRPRDIPLYRGRIVVAKNPNRYINDSQRRRAEEFYTMLYSELGIDLDEILEEPIEEDYPDPIEGLEIALSRDYGDYMARKKELLEKGRKWFIERARRWRRYWRIPEKNINDTEIYFADNRVFEYRGIRLRFTEPLFHGIEYSRVGWIISVIVETEDKKIYYTSDVNGPVIEDYAFMIIDEDPDILILDGPPTYLLGYTLNRINLQRAIENAVRIVKETNKLELIIYDHHLVREPRFRDRTVSVWREAEKQGIRLTTAAEYMGAVPVVLQYIR